jgi:NADH:ubiquinone oxidoreductase subunit E
VPKRKPLFYGREGPEGKNKEGTFMVEMASEKQWEQLATLLDQYRGKKGVIIPVLQQAQDIFGYLPKEVLLKISSELDLPISQIFGVVTFYAQFHLEPRGKNIIRSCQGTACHVRGAKGVLKAIRDKLGLSETKVTTDDLAFTLETVACIGACGLAPVFMINDDTHGRLSPESVGPILDGYMGK